MPSSVVITYAKVKPGAIDRIAEVFRDIHSGLLAGEKLFCGAELCGDRSKDTMILVTRWKSCDAWETFRGSRAVDALLKRLEPDFEAEPKSWVAESLVSIERGEGEATRVALGGGD